MTCNCVAPRIIKKGKYKNVQLYQCKCCHRKFRERYSIKRINSSDKAYIIHLHNRGNSIRGISYFTGFSHVSIIKALLRFSYELKEPELQPGQCYQVDEIKTFIAPKKKRKRKKKNKKNEYWIAYAINEKTGEVSGLSTGRRTKTMVAPLISKLVDYGPKRIYSDKLNIYSGLIPKQIHRFFESCTNKIERHHLTLRTHLKRLSRKTLCFSRSPQMLEASLKLYFWGQ